VQTTAWAVAADTLYQLNYHNSLFLNGSRGFFMPQLNSIQIASDGKVAKFQAEVIDQAEGGLKFADGRLSGSIAIFHSTLANRRNYQFVNGATAGSASVELVNLISTKTTGLEGVLNVRLLDGLTFTSNATYQHDRYTQYSPVAACTDCVGNALGRQPAVEANVGLTYVFRGFDASIRDTYTGTTYTSDRNNIKLAAYQIAGLDLGYTNQFSGGDKVRVSVSIYNLFDTDAATEGNPRQGTDQTGGQAYFIGRDVLPRRLFVRLNYKF